jgi:uncharacterized protein (UPF0548 family)
MFLIRKPTREDIGRFIESSRMLPLSYAPVGTVGDDSPGYDRDQTVAAIGRGSSDLERARAALCQWKHFEVGWVEIWPSAAGTAKGTIVGVLIHHLGFWSLNGCRVVYEVDGEGTEPRFGFAYGTLPNHAEAGEELFEVWLDRGTGEVMYRIRAASHPRAALARVGYPIARLLQARFRRDSVKAMRRAVESRACRTTCPFPWPSS